MAKVPVMAHEGVHRDAEEAGHLADVERLQVANVRNRVVLVEAL